MLIRFAVCHTPCVRIGSCSAIEIQVRAAVETIDNTMELEDVNGPFNLPSAIPEHMAVTSVGISNTAAAPAAGAPDPRHTAIPLKLPAVASASSTATNTVHIKAFIRRIMVDVKNLGRLSHEGVMGAGLAKETDGAVKATCRAIVFSVVFEYSILLIILLNMICISGFNVPSSRERGKVFVPVEGTKRTEEIARLHGRGQILHQNVKFMSFRPVSMEPLV